MAQISGAGRLRAPRGPRVALAALACWATGTLIFTGSPEDSTWRVAAVNVVYFTAVAFALVFLARTASATRGRERLCWGLLVAGSLVGLVGDLGWGEIQRSAEHAQARNLWLETRRVNSVVIVRIRDDGRGFDTSDPQPGLGLRYMRRRAGEVGAMLDVISFPGRGTTVQLRFDKK